MKKPVRLCLLFLLLVGSWLLSYQEAAASHYVGSDVTFTYTGTPGYYLLRVKAYRDCGGIQYGPTLQISGVSSCGGTSSAQLPLISTTDAGAAEVCATQLTECTGNPSVPGVQLRLYEGIIQLAPCASWVFTFTGNARNDDIINLNNGNSGSINWYNDAMINTLPGINNSSPVLVASPVPYVCFQDTVNYNPQATDPDGDSLVFSLVSARGAGGVAVPYTPGYFPTQPFGTPSAAQPNLFPTTIDSQTGQLSFMPMTMSPYVVVIRIEEYRKINGVPVLVGFIHRDVQVVVQQCTTPAPELGMLTLLQNNVAVSTFTFNQVPQLNACTPYCIEIPATSLGAATMVNLSLTSNTANEIPNSTFTVINQNTANPIGLLCFTPDPSLAGQTFFYTVGVSDNVCPIPNDFIKALQVEVVKNTGFSVQASATSICVGDTVQLSAQALAGTQPLTSSAYTGFVWSATDPATGQPVPGQFSGGQNTSTLLNPMAVPTQPVTFVLAGSTLVGCTDSAGVQVSVTGVQPLIVSITAPTTTLMQGQTTTLSAVVQGPAAMPNAVFSYSWSPINGLTSSTVADPFVIYSGQPQVTYTLLVNNGTCSASGQITFNFMANAAPIAGFTHQLAGCCELTITNTSVGGTSFTYDFGDGSPLSTQVSPTHVYTTSGNFTVTQIATNALGSDTISKTVSVLVAAPENMPQIQVALYPNPSTGKFIADLTAVTEAEPVTIEVFTLVGQRVLRQMGEGGKLLEINLQSIANGPYLVRVQLKDHILTRQLILQR